MEEVVEEEKVPKAIGKNGMKKGKAKEEEEVKEEMGSETGKLSHRAQASTRNHDGWAQWTDDGLCSR